jgi:uncharacterized membrane protein YsdA (DUF1294 family)
MVADAATRSRFAMPERRLKQVDRPRSLRACRALRLEPSRLRSARLHGGMGFFPLFLLWIYLGMSVLSYLMYWRDKSAAQDGRSRSRTPENQLHLADLLGGWPGALIAQQQFHHKTVKQTFQFAFWLTVVLNLAGCVWLTKSGFAVDLARSLAG